MDKGILKTLADWLAGCPALEGYRLNIGYLPESPREDGMVFSLDAAPGAVAGRQYLGSDAPVTRQFTFAVRSVAGYGPDREVNLAAQAVFTQLALWLEKCCRDGGLPELPAGMQAIWMEALDGGRLTENTAGTGKYEMRCALTYLQY